jgi:predicted DNA-binding transcriptional regulator YafY
VKATRLVSLLLSLQARGTATAEQFAAELGVSVRTVYRDIADLQAAGVPIYGERGDGGGYRLVGGYRTTLTGLTSDEAAAVLLSGAPGPAAQLGLGGVLASTRLKLLAAVPRGLRDAATRGEQRFHLDPGGWSHTADRPVPCLPDVASAVWNDRRLRISYRRSARTDAPSPERTSEVDPLGLVHKTGTWYLVATRGGDPLVFRGDRITEAVVLDAPAHRPDGFDLQAFWRSWEDAYAATLPTYVARVRLGPRAQRFRSRLGPLAPRLVEEEATADDGWTLQALTFDDLGVARAALLALSPEVEVLGPPELRASIAAAARELGDRHP